MFTRVIAVTVLMALSIREGKAQINLQEIRMITADTSSRYFYDTLVADFLRHPEDFEMTKAISLYYGKLYSRFYKPYHFSKEEVSFDDLVRSENYQKAISIGERILEKDPANFAVLVKLLKCYFEAKEEAFAQFTRTKVQVLHKAILHSGTGADISSTLKVIAIADEYAVMALMNLELLNRASQMKSSSVIDRWKVRPEKGKKKDLYFEVLLNKEAVSGGEN